MSSTRGPMPHAGHLPLQVGKYLISPLTQALSNGWFACSVTIRSGVGASCTERLLRITRLFLDPLAAADYARGEGLQWIGAPRSAAAV